MALTVTFFGGAGKVTGSNFLIQSGETKVLVDCGIEQGKDFCLSCTYDSFNYDVTSIAELVVTHAHLDHVGRIPRLVRQGFRGKIFMTPPTRDLAELILRDSVDILGQEASRQKLPPLYEGKDVDETFRLVEAVPYRQTVRISEDLSFILRTTGHILGSASVTLESKDGTRFALTGDIGNSPSPLLPDWEPIPDVDALLMESVYGDRLHPDQSRRNLLLKEELQTAIKKGGTILIPAFSMERTQLMLYELSNYFSQGDLPEIPVFLDSPLAINVTDVYEKWGSEYFKPEAKQEMKIEKSLFEFPFLKKTKTREESQTIDEVRGPKIIIAGAGMSHGGRIGRHEVKYLPDPKTTLFIVGYQAPGSPGRHLVEKMKQVRINGQVVTVRANVVSLEGWSAHADREQLLTFAKAALEGGRVKKIFTALGEPASERFLAQRIHDYLGGDAAVAEEGKTWEITTTGAKLTTTLK